MTYGVDRARACASDADLWRQRLGVLAAWLFAGGLLASFGLSIILLDRIGYQGYMASGGSFLQKVHPGTLMIAMALLARLASRRRPADYLRRKLDAWPELLFYALGFVTANVLGFAYTHYPATMMIDSFVPPAMILLLMDDLDDEARRRIAWGIIFFMAANAAIAIVEVAANMHLETFKLSSEVTDDPNRLDLVFDWRAQLASERRATALLGHPLSNALIQSVFLMTMAAPGARWIPFPARVVSILLSALALAAFAGRAAMLLSAAYFGWRGLVFLYEILIGRRRVGAGVWLALVAGAALLTMAITVAFSMGVFDEARTRFTHDAGSANARVAMFDLFAPLSWTSILFGPDPEQLDTWIHIEGLEFGIESFWLVFVLHYGAIIAGILIAGLFAFLHALYRAAGAGAGLVIALFIVQASASTSLSSKSVTFGLVCAILIALLREHKPDGKRRRAPPRPPIKEMVNKM